MTQSFYVLPESRRSNFDSGPLSWVIEEIREAFNRSRTALFTVVAQGSDSSATLLNVARTDLHQAHGALQIVDVDGVTILTDAIEDILRRMTSGEIPINHANVRAIEQAYLAVMEYLQELLSGELQQPMRLFPYYKELQEIRAVERIHPADLFFPTLENGTDATLLPDDTSAGASESEPDYASLRHRFEKSLLSVLTHPGAPVELEAAANMRDVVAVIEQAQINKNTRKFWRVMHGFAEMVASSQAPADLFIKQVCGRMNRQIKLLAQGSSSISERLLADALYCLAEDTQTTSVATQIREAFQLEGAIPADFAKKRYGKIDNVALGIAKATLSQAKNSWNRVTKGDVVSANSFSSLLGQLADACKHLKVPSLEKLFQAIESVSREAGQSTSKNDRLGFEIATNLLFIENTLGHLSSLPDDFSQRVGALIDRLKMVAAGEEPPESAQWLDIFTQQSQQRQTVTVLAAEMESSLRHIERILDEYHIDRTKLAALADIDPVLHEIAGVLSVLGQEDAMQAVVHTQAVIRQFCESGNAVEGGYQAQSIPEAVTQNITALGFFVEMLPQHPETARSRFIFDREQGIFHANLLEKMASRQTAAQSADPAFDPVLDIADKIPAPAVIKPDTRGAVMATPVSDEEIDAELLEIFMSEAEEVLDFVRQTVPDARIHRDDQDQLSTLRRSFHTLKGSGRMVGLTAFAEAAYSVEQVMNLWLAEARSGTPDLFALLDRAAEELGKWVEDLKVSGKSLRTPLPLSNAAERVKAGEAFAFDDVIQDSVISAPEISDEQASLSPQQSVATAENATDQPAAIGASAHSDVTVYQALEIIEAQPQVHTNVFEFPVAPTVSTAANDGTKQIGHLEISVPLYNTFVKESDDILRLLSQDFSEWRHEPNRAVSTRAIHASHTLAGISATVGIEALHDIAHALEVYLQTLECQPRRLTLVEFDLLQQCVERMKQMLQSTAINELPLPQPDLLQRLYDLQQEAATPAASAPILMEVDAVETAAASSPIADEENVLPESLEDEGEEVLVSGFRDTLDPDLLPVFLEEGRELLPNIGQTLRAWLHNPADTSLVPEVLRQLHTAKGSARMAGAMVLGQHLHMMESQIEDIQNSGVPSQHMLEDLLARHDYGMQFFDHLQHPEQNPPPAFAPSDIQQSSDGTEPTAVADASSDLLAVSSPPKTKEATATPTMPSAPVARVRVRADILDRMVNQAGEVSIARSKIENEVDTLRQSLTDLTDNLSRLRSQLREVEIQAESQITSHMAQSTDREFDPLEFDRYSRLQELTRMMTESVDDVASIQDSLVRTVTGATSDLENQAQITRALQQDLMQVRMVPFSSISERLYQVTRQTAKEVGKSVSLDIRGTAVEIDRGVLERMIGPLEHLLRNAVVHGIESRFARQAAGKQETGELLVEIRQEGNEVVIQISDDGRGLDVDRIREKALASGLISADRVFSKHELEDLIFRSGFTTADEISEVAGRGVGMDVVRSEAVALGGRVDIFSDFGKGTRFTINLPLTLAVSSVVLMHSGGNTYAVPSVLVEQVQQLRSNALLAARHDGEILWSGNRIALYFLSDLLGDKQTMPVEQPYTPVLILRSGNDRVALQVDGIIGNREVVVKNIGPQLARMIGIVGATVLGSGNIVLILNPVALAQRLMHESAVSLPSPEVELSPGTVEVTDAEGDAHVVAPEFPSPTPPDAVKFAPVPHKKNVVMVVDDSLTVRRVTQRFLQREGYEVVLAKDGVDALEKLQDMKPDIMLVDIEMPRMDGFDLIRNVRSDARIGKTPIIMITSRTASKHRNYAMELGANEYYGKPFQENQLLESIEEFLDKAPTP